MALYDPLPPTPANLALAAVRVAPGPVAAALDLSVQQVLNLAQLAEYLRTLPENYCEFSMGWYHEDDEGIKRDDVQPLRPGCGSSACAVGHGPNAGLAPLPGEQWDDYGERVFTGPYSPGTVSSLLWKALFVLQWERVDNTPRGAAARIAYVLAGGRPAADRLGGPMWPHSGMRALYAEYVA